MPLRTVGLSHAHIHIPGVLADVLKVLIIGNMGNLTLMNIESSDLLYILMPRLYIVAFQPTSYSTSTLISNLT